MGAQIGIDLDKAAELLSQGKLVAIPTETVYGLAANGLDANAVAGIFTAKNRPTFDPLILHVGSIAQAKSLCSQWPSAAEKLANAFWPGPLTLVLPKAEHVPDLVTSDNPTVALRMPNNPMSLSLIRSLSFPLAAPSANPFGYVSPTCAQHVADQLGDRIDYILDGGNCAIGIESTIVAVNDDNQVTVLRLGGLDLASISNTLGYPVTESLSMHSNPQAPGQLDQHYSPNSAMVHIHDLQVEAILEDVQRHPDDSRGFLWFSKQQAQQFLDHLNDGNRASWSLLPARHYYLSDDHSDRQAAMNLFGTLRQFDKDGCKRIYFSWAPDDGLGRAINDRLKRASSKVVH